LDTVLSSNVGEVIVVLHEAVRVREVCDIAVKFVQNDNYKEGIYFNSHGASDVADGFMICLSDLPLIQPDELNLRP